VAVGVLEIDPAAAEMVLIVPGWVRAGSAQYVSSWSTIRVMPASNSASLTRNA
jgi:hypothetical protein